MKQRIFRSYNEIMLAQVKARKADEETAKEEAEAKPATLQQLHNLVQHFNKTRHVA